MKAGHAVTPFYNDDLYIDRNRNLCVNVFLDSDCTDLIFWDADLATDDDSVLRLLKHDKDIICGVYPYKKDKLEFSAILDFTRNNNCKDEETGLVLAKSVPAGFMRIQRRVFNELKPTTEKDERDIYQFFKTGIAFPNDNNWYGEDSYFCKKWYGMGREFWIDPHIGFNHYGLKSYSGNLHDYLMGRRIDQLDGVEEGVPGWISKGELVFLKHLASRAESVVEIGSWKGRSTKALLEGCQGKVYAVDDWTGGKNETLQIGTYLKDIRKDFIKNVGGFPNLEVVMGRSIDAAEKFNGKKVDMVFIDAGHSYEECKEDIDAWLPKCKKIMCGHDYCKEFPGVMKAVEEKFKKFDVMDSIWIAEV